MPTSNTCDGCTKPAPTECLWLQAPLGLCAVHVHHDRECAEQARAARGGGKYVTFPDEQAPLPQARLEDERLMRAVQDYAADWRRNHKREGGTT